MAIKVKILEGSNFVDTEITSGTVGALRNELNISSGSSISVNATNVTDDKEIKEGDMIAAVTSNKTGGLEVLNFAVEVII